MRAAADGSVVENRAQSSFRIVPIPLGVEDQRVAAEAEQVHEERLVRLLGFVSPLTSIVIVLVVSPGAKVRVPDLACSRCRPSRCRWRWRS